jgi:hypothetical protein
VRVWTHIQHHRWEDCHARHISLIQRLCAGAHAISIYAVFFLRMRTLLVFDAFFYAVFVLCLALVSWSLISFHFASLGAGITHHYFCGVLPSQVFIKPVLHVWSFSLFHLRFSSCFSCNELCSTTSRFTRVLLLFILSYLRLPLLQCQLLHTHLVLVLHWRNFNRRPKCVRRLLALRSTWLSLWALPQRQSSMTCKIFFLRV